MVRPGSKLRELRKRQRLTLRQVEQAAAILAVRHSRDEYRIPISRLCDMETKDVIPTIHKVYSLAAAYGVSCSTILRLYGVDTTKAARETLVWEARED